MAASKIPVTFVIGAVDKASSVFDQVSRKGVKIGDATTKVGNALTLGVTAPILAAGAASLDFAFDFEKSLGNVSTVIDRSTEDIGAIGDTIVDIGKRVPVGLTDLSAALYDVRGAGVSAADQFLVLESSAKLAVAGVGTTTEAVDLATSAINAFGLDANNVEDVTNTLFQTINVGKGTLSDLATGFGAVAGTVNSAGIQLDDFMSNVSALTTTGVKASQAYTQLQAVISGFTRAENTADGKKLYKKLGVKSFKELIDVSGGFQPAMRKAFNALGGDSAQVLKLVGSVEALNAVLGLTGTLADDQKKALDLMRSGEDAISGAFDAQAQTRAAQLQLTKNRVQAVSLEIADRLLPIVDRLVTQVEKWTKAWDELSDSEKDTVFTIGAVVAAMGPLVSILGRVIQLAGAARAGLAAIGAASAAGAAASTAATTAAAAAGATPAAAAAAGAGAAAKVGLGAVALPATLVAGNIAATSEGRGKSAQQALALPPVKERSFWDILKQATADGSGGMGGANGAFIDAGRNLPAKVDVKVKFDNLPEGAQVRVVSDGANAKTDLGRAGSSQ